MVIAAINQKEAFQDTVNRGSKRGTPVKETQLRAKKTWVKPQGNEVKTNWDAALNTSANTTGLGGLIRLKWGCSGVFLLFPAVHP